MEKYEDLLVSLRKIIRSNDLYSKELAKKAGVTGPQLLILKQISRTNGISPKELAETLNLSQGTITSIIDRMQDRELVTRIRSQTDKRRFNLSLTEKGEALLESAPPPMQDYFIERFNRLEDWEQTQLLAAFQRVASMMNAQDIDQQTNIEQ